MVFGINSCRIVNRKKMVLGKTSATVTYQLLLNNHIVVMLWGMYHYGNTSCQVRNLLLIKVYYSILPNQINITDFVKGL